MELNSRDCVCVACTDSLKYISNCSCTVCGIPMDGRKLCGNCVSKGRIFKKNIAAFEYQGAVRASILRYKQLGVLRYTRVYSKIIKTLIQNKYSDIKFNFIMPSPSHKISKRQRGFDHIAPIAKIIAKDLHIPYLDSVIKVRHTAKQTTLDYAARKKNLINTYIATQPDILKQKNILVIDDVFTTGTTIEEIAKTLKTAGALNVYSATLAITCQQNPS